MKKLNICTDNCSAIIHGHCLVELTPRECLNDEITWLTTQRDALAARLALIERGCAVFETTHGVAKAQSNIPDRNGEWIAYSKQGKFVQIHSPTLLGLIEKVGGAE